MYRVLLLLAVLSMTACSQSDRTDSGAITSVAADAKHAEDAAQNAVAAAQAATRRDEAASQVQPNGSDR